MYTYTASGLEPSTWTMQHISINSEFARGTFCKLNDRLFLDRLYVGIPQTGNMVIRTHIPRLAHALVQVQREQGTSYAKNIKAIINIAWSAVWMHLISGTKGQSNRQTVNGTALTTRALPKEPIDIPQAIGKRSPHIRCRLEHTTRLASQILSSMHGMSSTHQC